MFQSLFKNFRHYVALPLAMTMMAVPAAHADFHGGGSLFGFTSQCEARGWSGVVPVRVRHSASEDANEPPSEVTLAFGTGTEHFAMWGSMAPTGTQFLGAAGRQTWTRFVFYDNRPLIRIVQRTITERINPSGPATIPNARSIILRMRIQNFSNIPGCAATLTANLRRS